MATERKRRTKMQRQIENRLAELAKEIQAAESELSGLYSTCKVLTDLLEPCQPSTTPPPSEG